MVESFKKPSQLHLCAGEKLSRGVEEASEDAQTALSDPPQDS